MNSNLLESTKTLTGVSLVDLPALLDEELPKKAYKSIPGADYLTDIDPSYMRDKFNKVFGLSGFGWGYSYSTESISVQQGDVTYKKGKPGEYTKAIWFAELLELNFWYKLQKEDGAITTHEIPATGASDNAVAAFALKGAITAAIGNAASNLGWQKSVYMGLRSHKTVGKKKAAPKRTTQAAATAKTTPAKAAAKPASSKPVPKPAPQKNAVQSVLTLDSFFKIPLGPKTGEPLAAQEIRNIQFYAKMKTGGDANKILLSEKAQAFLKRPDKEELHTLAASLWAEAQAPVAVAA